MDFQRSVYNISEESRPSIQDLASNDSGCSNNWMSPNHSLFQIAHTAMLLAYLSPNTTKGVLLLHTSLALGYLLLTAWAWVVLCTPDMFSWSFSFLIINAVQVFFLLYKIRPVKFAMEFEDVYTTMFAPLNVTRPQFKKLIATETCHILTLHEGEAYAHEEITKTDKLGLLINGIAHVCRGGKFLHQVRDKQFLDSPEFQANSKNEEKFHVTILAITPCRYIMWPRHNLEYLFSKEPHISTVITHLLARDITNKLYQLNDKLPPFRGQRLDIRLPSISSAAMSGLDFTRLKKNLQNNKKTSIVSEVPSNQINNTDTDTEVNSNLNANPLNNSELSTDEERDGNEVEVTERTTLVCSNGIQNHKNSSTSAHSVYCQR